MQFLGVLQALCGNVYLVEKLQEKLVDKEDYVVDAHGLPNPWFIGRTVILSI